MLEGQPIPGIQKLMAAETQVRAHAPKSVDSTYQPKATTVPKPEELLRMKHEHGGTVRYLGQK